MTALERARQDLREKQQACDKARHSFTIRARDAKTARKTYLAKKTAGNRKEYMTAKKIRAHRLRVYRRAQTRRNVARAKYLALKAAPKKSMRVRALEHALADVGITERGGNNRGPEVEKIIRAGGGRVGDAWCLWFVIAKYKQAGSKLAWEETWGAVRRIKVVCIRVKAAANIAAGHIVEFTFEHTGLFITWCDAAGNAKPRLLATHAKVCEGNTGDSGAVSDSRTGGDGVKVKIRPKSYIHDVYRAAK
jgi:hypothetical protein